MNRLLFVVSILVLLTPVGSVSFLQSPGAARLGSPHGVLEGSSVAPGALSSAHSGLASGWTALSIPSAPSARSNASMTYDPAEGKVVLFGGWGGKFLGDTWEYRGGVWTSVPVSNGPPARSAAVLEYDPTLGGAILFGGTNGTALSDTWEFRGGSWTKLSFSLSPPARSGAVAAFDPATGQLLVFGGTAARVLADTWGLSNSGWSPLGGSTHPPPLAYASMTYDESGGYALLFGGINRSVSSATWEYNRGAWSLLSPSSSPTPRYLAAMTFDSADGISVLFGGRVSALIGNTWEFDRGAWTALPYGTHPSSRSGASIAFDAADGYALLFGGNSNVLQGDTWAYKLRPQSPGWNYLNVAGGARNREQGVTAFDPADGYTVLFGGWNHSATNLSQQFLNDTWVYKAGVWTQLHPVLSPSQRRGAMMAYDPVDGYLVMFGGSDYVGYLNDTWTFRAGVWSHLVEPVSPPTRRSAAIAFDQTDGYVVLFGGHNGSGLLPSSSTFYYDRGDTWTFRGGLWTNRTTATHPSARAEPNMDYDAADGYVLLFGGYIPHKTGHGDIEQADTWKFVGGVWTNLTSSLPVHPSARDGEPVVFDPNHGYILLFGGDAGAGNPNDAWAYRAGWSQICSNCGTLYRSGSHATYDAADGYVMYIGGDGIVLGATLAWVAPVVAHATTTTPVTDAGLPVSFSSTVMGGLRPLQYQWVFGDGNTSALSSPTERFPSAGVLSPRLLVTDSTGVYANISLSLTVHAALRASVTPSPTVADVGHPFDFAASTAGGTPPYTYHWNLGDGGTSNLTSLAHVYSLAGPRSGNVTVTDRLGQTASAGFTVTVNAVPTPRVTDSRNVTDPGVPIFFTGSANNGTGPFAFNWSFGDGTNGSGSNISHAYSAAGMFVVTLHVTDSFRVMANVSTVLTVNPPLHASVSTPAPTDPGKTVSFTSNVSGGTGPFSYNWSFGDGSNGTGSIVSHAYLTAGAYLVTLHVTDRFQTIANGSAVVTVNSLLHDSAGFPGPSDAGMNVSFSTNVSGGTAPYAIHWAFGDNTSSASGGNATHAYATPGVYNASVTVNDSVGASVFAFGDVVIHSLPNVTIRIGSTGTFAVGQNASFASVPSGGTGAYTFVWSFGDGNGSSGPNATHAYSTPGNYTARLIATDSVGAQAVASMTVVVAAPARGAHRPRVDGRAAASVQA
ncbi:MAG: PKD domain-containing protein [Thermoplasmata archaeon]|nr:PKD domain-containing protein [Thermoplasmata archaeon]